MFMGAKKMMIPLTRSKIIGKPGISLLVKQHGAFLVITLPK